MRSFVFIEFGLRNDWVEPLHVYWFCGEILKFKRDLHIPVFAHVVASGRDWDGYTTGTDD